MPFMILDIQLLVQGFLYLTTFVLGFIVSIPLGVTTINFAGHCILYADVDWKNKTHLIFTPSHKYNCNFPIYLCVFACIFYGLGMTVYHAYALTRKDPNIGSQMWVIPFILLNSVIAFATFISSCMISVGFLTFCKRLTTGHYPSCASGQTRVNWSKGSEYKVNGSTYFTYLTISQTASWVTFLVIGAQVVLGIIRFVRNLRRRSQDQFQDPQPSIDAPTNARTPSDLEEFASVQPSA